MDLIVQKFGGDSIATLEGMAGVADIVISKVRAGHKVVVALSAMQGETDRLINLASSVSPLLNADSLAEYDSIIATGEQVSSGLLALILQGKGIKARSWLSFQCGMIASGWPSNGQVQSVRDIDVLLRSLNEYDVAVVAGFQAVTASGNRIITLGRNGTDVSAVALAVASHSKYCEIYKNVQGVYTADPDICPRARLISHLSHGEMLNMSTHGAAILHPEAVRIAMQHNLTLRMGSIFASGDIGTTVSGDVVINDSIAIAVTHTVDLSLAIIKYPIEHSETYNAIIDGIKDNDINVSMFSSNIALMEEDNSILRLFLFDSINKERMMNLIRSIDTEGIIHTQECEDMGQVSVITTSKANADFALQRALILLEARKIPVAVSRALGARCTIVIKRELVSLAVNALHEDLVIRDRNAENAFFGELRN